ncbi:MAG: hypothetical protein KGI52_03040 [Burkholderiales bacterium]|nr:hypothetical protein [Burkholderiales bacterium]
MDDRRLSAQVKAVFAARVAALSLYAQGQPLALLSQETAVTIGSIYRWIDRAQQIHADGRPWGYRALLPYIRVKTYERTSEPKVLKEGKAGNAGAFTQLLIRYPKLERQLRKELTSGAVKLMPSINEQGRLQGVVGALGRFQSTCRELGLTAADYPLSQRDKCVRSLARHLRASLKADAQLTAKAAGVRVKPSSALRGDVRDAPRAFDTVEFDAHKLDLRLKVILDRDPIGGEHAVPIERAWLLAVIDVATRCILGWHLVFGKECNRFDVIEALRRAVLPIPRPQLDIPGARLIDSGGYACEVMPQTQYAVWRQIRLDNARAHLSADCLDLLCDTLGCQVDFGPAYHPDDRPFIERYFATVVQTFSRRLPGAIEPKGESDRMRLLGQLRDKKRADRLVVSAQELDELLAMMVWNYNGTPHSSLGGLTPLEAMQHHVLGIGRQAVRLRHLPIVLQKQPRLLHDPIDCVVHGNSARGERPHISYLHVRYTSGQLASRSDLVGKAIHVHVDPQDLRALTAVTSDGEILEPLWASGPWRNHVHSAWLRREFFAAKRRKQLDSADGADPIASFVALRKKAASKSKRAATDVARIEKEQRQRTREQEPPADAEGPPTSAARDPLSQLVSGPVKGKDLHIERGFAR